MAITRVGLGAWAIGGADWRFGWGAQRDDDSISTIRHAVELGINWIDTAAVYGLGHSEEMIAKALRDYPLGDRPFVFTKCGMAWDADNHAIEPRRVANAASIEREVEASLTRLGVERIDLYQVHWPPADNTPIEDYWDAMVDLRRRGLVRAIGLSNHDAAQLAAAEAIGHVDAFQPPFSMVRRGIAETAFPWCADHDTGVIVYSPMQSGLLSGDFSADRVAHLPSDDWRSRSPRFAGPDLAKALALVDAVRPIAAEHDTTPGVIAIAWTLAWTTVTGAIVGARNPAQIDGWARATSLSLSQAECKRIAAAITATGVGSGPTHPPAT